MFHVEHSNIKLNKKDGYIMETLKKIINSYLIVFVAEAVIGLLLLINPSIFTSTISYVLGGLLLAFGVIKLITYFREDNFESEVLMSIILCATGIFIIAKPDFISKILAFFFGVYMLCQGISSIKGSLIIKEYNKDSWIAPMTMAVLTTILGVVIVLNPFSTVTTALKILGVALIISAIFSIYNGMVTKRKITKIKKSNDYIDIK